MDNLNTSRGSQEQIENVEKLVKERKKVSAHCVNLECKHEQLKILIERLHRISSQREDLYNQIQGPITELDMKKSSITEELHIAKESSVNLEKTIINLKEQITKIDNILCKII